MTIEELKQTGAIFLPRIEDGWNTYKEEKLIISEEEAYRFFLDLWNQHEKQGLYIDFYYYTLDQDTQAYINTLLTPEEITHIKNNTPEQGHLIFPCSEMLLKIVTKLNAHDMLFSTIYDSITPTTYWGNYNKEYIGFSNKE